MNIVVWVDTENKQSRIVCESFSNQFTIRNLNEYKEPISDVAIFYGLSEKAVKLKQDYEDLGLKTVYFDGGFWGRAKYAGDLNGHYKVSINSYQCEHMIDVNVPQDRFNDSAIKTKPLKRTTDPILLIGVTIKSSVAYKIEFESWEKEIIKQIRLYTDRPIIYRQKTSSEKKMSNLGDRISHQNIETIDQALDNSSFLVTRHSNSAIDSLINGVPFYTEYGLAQKWATPIISIENPIFPSEEERQMILNRAAYSQWSIKEIRSGEAWNYLRRFCEKS